MALYVKDNSSVLPPHTAIDLPGYGCLLGNLLDVGSLAFTQPDSFDMVSYAFHSYLDMISIFS